MVHLYLIDVRQSQSFCWIDFDEEDACSSQLHVSCIGNKYFWFGLNDCRLCSSRSNTYMFNYKQILKHFKTLELCILHCCRSIEHNRWPNFWTLLIVLVLMIFTVLMHFNNSPSQHSNHPDDLFQSRYVTPGFKRSIFLSIIKC